MSSDPWVVVPVTLLIVALSAFFVAVEFAALAAKRHRLEERAASSPAARAALRNSAELTLVLAGAQLGITACTLALGALSKPAVDAWLTPAFVAIGLPSVVADVTGFVLALFVVTFIHLVVGEMAPKSWAIAHPEQSSVLLAPAMRAFMWLFRPALRAMNGSANWMLRRVGVQPVDEIAAGHSPDTLRVLVQHSVEVGALEEGFSAQISGALQLQDMTVADLVDDREVTSVPATATAGDVRAATRRTGHLRILLGDGERLDTVVHVRDTLVLADDAPAAPVGRPVFSLPAGTPVATALRRMQETRNHLAVVTDGGRVAGVVTLADVLRRLFPQSEPVG
ncbi:Hemolysin, contains CBS domains [Klenkia marina]|uniref:Hemolysin, contains CBS domains n=1 Tax=Klenkia marina TaxID=1960309 RepID=A0A1G4YNU7_9ACTN|nr:hemolysin family protein [Klenkia marina]SCX55147.1 Hemolysin, contains CBS domains [Klenkia marina]